MRDVLEQLEAAGGDLAVPLAWLAGRRVRLDEDELRGAIRRAELLLAAGGDPRRALELHGRAVTALAADLDRDEARAELRSGLAELDAGGLPRVGAELERLAADPDLAWRAYAGALLADELSD